MKQYNKGWMNIYALVSWPTPSFYCRSLFIFIPQLGYILLRQINTGDWKLIQLHAWFLQFSDFEVSKFVVCNRVLLWCKWSTALCGEVSQPKQTPRVHRSVMQARSTHTCAIALHAFTCSSPHSHYVNATCLESRPPDYIKSCRHGIMADPHTLSTPSKEER